MPSTKVQKTHSEAKSADGDVYKTTQYRTTIPKNLAEALDLGQGTEIEWSIESGKKLSLEKQE